MTDPLAQLVEPPIFVVGHHRSGTTWVYDVLAHRPDVAGVFESWMFTTDHGLGGLLHWGQWHPDSIEAARNVAKRPAGLAQLISHQEAKAASRELATSWLSRALEPQHRYLVEKSPDHLYAVLAISDVFPDARFINVIRDGRDVAVSVLAAQVWTGSKRGRRAHLQDAAKRWRNAMEVSKKVAEHLGPRYIEVTYEELLADPANGIRDIYRFCGLPDDDATIADAVESTRFERVQEGPDDQFRRGGRTGDWRKAFSARDRWAFRRAAGSTLIERNYANSSWWWLRP